MSADIVERLELLAKVYGGTTLTEAAAEIGRLRGEVETIPQWIYNWMADRGIVPTDDGDGIDASELLEALNQYERDILADPAPAMPNGVEGLVAEIDERISTADRLGYAIDIGVHIDLLRRIASALRAAGNRDAAGVVACRGPGICEPCSRAAGCCFKGERCGRTDCPAPSPNSFRKPAPCPNSTPAAVPAGEAVASDDARRHAASLRGISSHIRACPPYEKLRGDADCIDAAADFIMRTPQPADGEAVAVGELVDSDDGEFLSVQFTPEFVAAWSASKQLRGTKLYTTPPAPVQAAPQEGEAEALARKFHDTYERLAPSFGYETRQETRQFDPETPNGRLMIAVCAELAAHHSACELGAEPPAGCIVVEEASCVPHVHPEYGVGLFFTEDAALQHRGDSQEVGRV